MKNRKKQVAASSMAIVLCAGMLAGCGSNGGDSSKDAQNETGSTDDKEIVYWHIGTDEPDVSIFDYAVNKFNEETDSGYTIKNIAAEADAYKEKLIIAMSSGECPDVYTNWSGGPMNEYIEAGFAQPIDELFNNSPIKDKILDATVAQGQYKDKMYALGMLNVAVSGIFYNKEMFAEYGLQVPTTVSELENVCNTLVANSKIPFALANAPKWTGSMYFMNLAARKGGLEPFDAAVAGTGTFEDECFIYAGEKIQDWVKNGYFPEGVNSLSEGDGQSKQMFYTEEAAMKLIGSWDAASFKADSPEFFEKVGWFPFPAVDGSTADPSIMIGTVGDQFISFNCEGDKLKAAFEMVEHYYDEESIKSMVEAGKIPPIKGAKEMLQGDLPKQIMEAVENASSTQLWYDQYLPPAVAQVHLDTSQELFGLTMTPEEAAKEFQEAMKEVNNN